MLPASNFLWKLIFNLAILFSHYSVWARKLSHLWPSVSSHPAWPTLNSQECGVSATDRIIGGQNAALGQFPWIARLGYITEDTIKQGVDNVTNTKEADYGDDIDWLCGGVLISPLHVITAAHCSDSHEYSLSIVRLGEHDIASNPDCQVGVCAPPVQDIRIAHIVNHPQFSHFHYDIAMLVLAHPALLHNYVTPICLPQAPQMDLFEGEALTVAGWGKMNMTTEERAKILQFVLVPLVPPGTCGKFGNKFQMTNGELCAGAQMNKDACGGDSGGPLMKIFDSMDGPKTYLVGVVSFGPTMCGTKKPGVYTSIAFYEKWILDNVMKYTHK